MQRLLCSAALVRMCDGTPSHIMGALAIATQQVQLGRSFSTEPNIPKPTIDFGFREVEREQKVGLVGQVFSSVASSYDVMNDLMSVGMHRLWKDQLVEALRPFPGMHHLDVAGGTGDVAFRVLRAIRAAEAHRPSSNTSPSPQGPGSSSRPGAGASPGSNNNSSPQGGQSGTNSGRGRGSVVVCDINAKMLEEGRKKALAATDLAEELGVGLQFVEGNAEMLPQFSDASFDSYTIAFGIRNVTDRAAALREAHRVLKPGGRFLCLEFSTVSQPALRQLYDAYSFAVIPRIGGLVAGDEQSYQYLVESIRQFPDQDVWAGMIEDAGFKAVGYENILGGVVAMHHGYKLA
eukprot:CAMPEP_0119108682 /NCGR_PEP_ID=MMETSP1180-20130426/15601_1 /TAXON_ID=3052 ORGANISM="Chlamydomonas cf sp, Strain CCMP681" /NCGR_SAMPLE_ID=MMETSP1180 /ASSEMBLY_ACC=CAM_ASM_000741 /LENGTH=347 /DNA_ID=CAMNT_0007094327 /DNA_START=9 /DNA_END=1052 /DNA_ORIENTATION=+